MGSPLLHTFVEKLGTASDMRIGQAGDHNSFQFPQQAAAGDEHAHLRRSVDQGPH